MDPILKTYLDVASRYDAKSAEIAEALRVALAQVGSDTTQLAESLAYLLHRYGDTAVSTFQMALLQHESGESALVGVINSGDDLIAALSFKSVREFLIPRIRNDRNLVAHVQAALAGTGPIKLEAATALCSFAKSNIAAVFRPGRVESHEVSRLLLSAELPPDEFFRQCGDTLLNCTGRPWLDDVIRYIIAHYGHSARAWFADRIRTDTPPDFWQTAIAQLSDADATELAAADLSSEQRKWLRSTQLKRLRRELDYRLHDLSRSRSNAAIIVHSPLLFDPAVLQGATTSSKPVCTWLRSEPAETAIRSWFDEAGLDLQRTYGSPEDSITGSLCAYLDARAKDYEAVVDAAWRIRHPNQSIRIDVGYVDCRRDSRDVGGADFALILSTLAGDTYKRSSFVAFQCKKVRGGSLSLSAREIDQLRQLRSFTHASCYLLYPCDGSGYGSTPPVVVCARTVDGLLAGRRVRTLDRGTLVDVGRGLGEYFVADLLSGWSGDERWEDPTTIREVVEHGLQPMHILEVAMSVIPIEENQQR